MVARGRVARLLRALSALLLLAGVLSGSQKSPPASRARAQPKPKAAATPDLTPRLNPKLEAARKKVLGARPLAMYYYLDDAAAFESLRARGREITVLAPQSFWIDAEGFVHGGVPARAAEAARNARVPLMPLVINPGFDRNVVSSLLRSSKAQERAAMYLGYLAERDNFVGFQLDLENIDPADGPLLTAFVRRVAARLHRDRRLLSVAVVPRFPPSPSGTQGIGGNFTGEWSAAYDYAALARTADFLALMTYDHSTRSGPPGPIAGYEWVKKALDYATGLVPPAKLLLGLPFYGREWTESAVGTSSRALAHRDVRALLERPGLEVRWDERWRSPWFRFEEDSALRTVWFEDARSLKEKLQFVRDYLLRGFAAWRLGSEDPGFWPLATEMRGRPQTGPQTGKLPAAPRKNSERAREPASGR
jgi:spore germination protein YaaH